MISKHNPVDDYATIQQNESVIRIRVGCSVIFETTRDMLTSGGGMLSAMFRHTPWIRPALTTTTTDRKEVYILKGASPINFFYILAYLENRQTLLLTELSLIRLEDLRSELDYYQLKDMEKEVIAEIVEKKKRLLKENEERDYMKNTIAELLQLKTPSFSDKTLNIVMLENVEVGRTFKRIDNNGGCGCYFCGSDVCIGEVMCTDRIHKECICIQWKCCGRWTNEFACPFRGTIRGIQYA